MAAKKTKREKKVDVIWCSHCGTEQPKIVTKTFAEVKIGACKKCGKKPVSVQALLLAADITGDDITRCPACNTQNLNVNFCFACGTGLA
jgi:hypothetical protein